MKILRDYRVTGALYVNDTGVEAQVSDQVTLFLDRDAEPLFPVSIIATIQHPITKIECGSVTSYSLEYNEANIVAARLLLRAQDIIDATVVSGVLVVATQLGVETAARIAADVAHEADTTAHLASSIPFTPTGSIAATNVQAAIAEVKVTTGTGVAAALALPIGTTGAVQLNGDPLTPTSIVLPDMTGIIAPSGRIGFKNGYLATSDGVTPGGKAVAQRRYTGIAAGDFSGQPRSSAFTKLVGVPFTASEFAVGREFNLTGHLMIKPRNFGFTGVTNLIFGTAYNAGSVVAFNQSNPATNWMAWNYSGLTSLLKDEPLRYEVLSSTRFFTPYAGGTTGLYDGFKYLRSPLGAFPSIYDATNTELVPAATAQSGTANTLWFMLQVSSSTPGSYGNGDVDVHYDLTLEFTN